MYANSPKKTLTYKIFKSGVEWASGSINGTTVRSVEKKYTPAAGEYSVRVYSSSKDQSAYGGLQVYK